MYCVGWAHIWTEDDVGQACCRKHKSARQKNFKVSSKSCPTHYQEREQNTAKLLNPVPYQADYFGHKMHLDQNEKLVMYGCTTVLAIDGYSSSVLAVASMLVKNNIEIYHSVFSYYFYTQSKV